jgi:hypothetical protein
MLFWGKGEARNMTVHLYLSLVPEALIASMLPPEEFGTYYSVGYSKKTRGQAMFIELSPDFRNDFFPIKKGITRCIPHADGSPKKSVYVATYRVLEHIPLTDVDTLYLVVSTLPPLEMYRFLTQDPDSLIHIPAVCFVELRLGELARDPEFGEVRDLPYENIYHLREALVEVTNKNVHTKMVDRIHTGEYPYRMIDSGIYIGNVQELAFFPLPPREELRNKYYRWWRTANS